MLNLYTVVEFLGTHPDYPAIDNQQAIKLGRCEFLEFSEFHFVGLVNEWTGDFANDFESESVGEISLSNSVFSYKGVASEIPLEYQETSYPEYIAKYPRGRFEIDNDEISDSGLFLNRLSSTPAGTYLCIDKDKYTAHNAIEGKGLHTGVIEVHQVKDFKGGFTTVYRPQNASGFSKWKIVDTSVFDFKNETPTLTTVTKSDVYTTNPNSRISYSVDDGDVLYSTNELIITLLTGQEVDLAIGFRNPDFTSVGFDCLYNQSCDKSYTWSVGGNMIIDTMSDAGVAGNYRLKAKIPLSNSGVINR